jgi:hypothetical protein
MPSITALTDNSYCSSIARPFRIVLATSPAGTIIGIVRRMSSDLAIFSLMLTLGLDVA